jgi:hypothetical protein
MILRCTQHAMPSGFGSLVEPKCWRGSKFLQSAYSSGFNISGVQGIAFLVNQAQSCSCQLWGVGTPSSTKTLW